jgi:hypothetical protein
MIDRLTEIIHGALRILRPGNRPVLDVAVLPADRLLRRMV